MEQKDQVKTKRSSTAQKAGTGPCAQQETLWYTNFAEKWEQALPVGNGRMGGMVYGRIWDDTLQLNEESVNADGRRERINPDTAAYFSKIRALTFAGNTQEAENLALMAWSSVPESMSDYQPLAKLFLRTFNRSGEITAYRRWLDMSEGICHVSYTMGEGCDRREIFASHPDDVIVYHVECDALPMELRIRLHRDHFGPVIQKTDDNTLSLLFDTGSEKNVAMARVLADEEAQVEIIGEHFYVRGARWFTVLFTAATTYRTDDPLLYCKEILDRAQRYSYEQLRARHVADYRALYERMSLRLCDDQEKNDIPTDQRIARMRTVYKEQGESALVSDPLLAQQLFSYARYLTISASRPGTLPMNLQGIWCDDYQPGWGCRYTVNINTQMNYWPTEASALPECHTVLLDHMLRMLPRGQECARKLYGCRGFVCHHNTDIYGDCAPQDQWIPGSYWVLGGAWLALHLWEHYRYSGDISYLQRAYPILEQSCLFFEDFLQENEAGYLVLCPSVSPENTYLDKNGCEACFVPGAAMDTEILHELFICTAQATRILGKDDAFAQKVEELDARLCPVKIGENGCVREWMLDVREAEPGHRHISHLWGLYPARQFTKQTPEFFAAARKTIERRLAHGSGGTGWSRAWLICMWARLCDGEKTQKNLDVFCARSLYDNMFCAHPPFQIDGNFGVAAGILEMVAQTDRDGALHLLPALPPAWRKEGEVCGLRLPGKRAVDFAWKDGKILYATEYDV